MERKNETLRKLFESHYTWIEGFNRNVRRYYDRMAMIDPYSNRQWTYKELNNEVNRLANTLLEDGFKDGDVVMVMTQNCPEFAFAYIATQKIHGVMSPVSFRLSAGELVHNLNDSNPKVIIFDSKRKDTVLQAVKTSGLMPSHLIVTDGITDKEVMSYHDYVEGASNREPSVVEPHNIYEETTRLYTSGTTGRPKGVPLTSINEVLSAHDIMIHFPMSFRDVTMNTTPWFHRGGIHCGGPCPTFYAGGTLVVMNKFDAVNTLKYVSRYHITFVIGVPTVLEELADAQEKNDYDLSSLSGIITMGSPLERSACLRYQKVLTPNIYNGYGTTETLWNTFLRPFDLPEYAGTAGASMVDDDVRVVKIYEDRKAEPDDVVAMDGQEIGEVVICSPAKSPYKYFNNEKETENKYYKGFIYTGDLATWDQHQYITILGRKDDMIISSGENIYPTEIEEVLNKHPKVKDCIVTSVPDKIRGQVVTAYIVRSGHSLKPEDLDQFCKDSPDIANFKRPRFYRFVEQIPRNATGKKLHVKIKAIAKDDLINGLLYRV
ncbi:MAG TPA: AMP-dependent synthetase [Prevotella sp.]|nr:AMP-dependent synthetase [Prevotella sp.]